MGSPFSIAGIHLLLMNFIVNKKRFFEEIPRVEIPTKFR